MNKFARTLCAISFAATLAFAFGATGSKTMAQDPPAEPPSARTELPIPPELDALVLSCLAKDRALRPQSARELLQRLDGITLQHDWNDTRARKWWNEHLPPEAV